MDQLGGDNPEAAIRYRMKYLFTDTVLDKYTWRGTAEKDPFKKFKFLNNLIYGNVRSNFTKIKYARDKYNSYMVQWLKHSTTRQRTVVYSYPNRNPHGEESDKLDESLDEDEYQSDGDEDSSP